MNGKLPFKHFLLLTLLMTLFFQLDSFALKAQEQEQTQVNVSAQAAILLDVDSGRVLYEKNADQTLRIASITKIMTALVAIEQGNLKDKVTTSTNAFGVEGSSIFLRLGEKLTLEDMIYGLMLRSGNDAAVAIAEHIGGSKEGFVYLMNQKAGELGMSSTVFSNPHGLDDHEEHYSSARDMVILTAYAMKNKNFAKIVGTKRKTAPLQGEKWDRVWHNKNRLLGMYPYADGVKTGFTKRANRTLVSSATKDGHQFVAVTLNAPDDWNDHIQMFEYGFDHFTKVTLVEEKEEITDERLRRKDGFFQVSRTFSYPLTKKEHVQQKIILDPVFHDKDIEKQSIPYPAGYISFSLGQQEIAKIPLQFVLEKNKERSLWKSFLFFIERFVGGI